MGGRGCHDVPGSSIKVGAEKKTEKDKEEKEKKRYARFCCGHGKAQPYIKAMHKKGDAAGKALKDPACVLRHRQQQQQQCALTTALGG